MERQPDDWLTLTHSKAPYWREGAGPDLVFVHGWPLDGRTWRNVVPHLSTHFTCHVFDLPFAGQNQWTDDTPVGVSAFEEATVDAIEAMELGATFGLVAHDSGGLFARLAAARMPERISGIALGNTEIPEFHSWRMKAVLSVMRAKSASSFYRKVLGTTLGRKAAFRDCVRDLEFIEAELTPRFVTPVCASDRAFEGMMKLVKSLKAEDFDQLTQAHQHITAPVHHIWGGADTWFPTSECKKMLSSYAGEATLTVFEGFKLFVHEEQAERFANEVFSFFSRKN